MLKTVLPDGRSFGIYDAIALLVTLSIQLSGGLNILGWGIVAVYLFFTIGFGYFVLPQNITK